MGKEALQKIKEIWDFAEQNFPGERPTDAKHYAEGKCGEQCDGQYGKTSWFCKGTYVHWEQNYGGCKFMRLQLGGIDECKENCLVAKFGGYVNKIESVNLANKDAK